VTAPVLTLAALNDVEVAVTIVVGTARCRVSDVLTFAEGVVVPLGASAQAPVDLLVNGVAIARGEIVELEDGSLAIEVRTVYASAQSAEFTQ
jgi:flagellar motor switch protein FliN/FliY